MTKPKLSISFSGGRTSALMTYLALKKYKDTHDMVVTFANTGCEEENTLKFVDQCDRILGFPTVWLEAVIDPREGYGITHKVVDYMTAARNGEPFRDYIAKYGIPNKTTPQCTGKLKELPMVDYLKTVGFVRGKKTLNYDTAIGIRADEIDRVSSKKDEFRFVYPLADEGVTKPMVLQFWRNMPFDLDLPGEHYGNCVTCWKKSDRKLMTIAVERPEKFRFFEQMEKEFGEFKAHLKAGHNGRRYFFRGHKSVADIMEMARKPFSLYSDAAPLPFDPDLDVGSACGESCEIGADT